MPYWAAADRPLRRGTGGESFSLRARIVWLLSLLVLAIGLLAPTAASAQAVVCDVNITIGQYQPFSGRDVRTDCPGYVGTPDYISGGTFRQADSGNRDIYTSNGTSAPDVPYTGAVSANTWESQSGSFTFKYTPDTSPILATTVTDTFRVDIKKANTSAIATVYYHVTIVPPAPVLTGVSPASSGTAGGISVVLTGTNFPPTNVGVSFGGTAGTNLTVNSSTQITVTAPAHAAGLVGVAVTTGGGTAIRPNAFGYYNPATNAAAFSPAATSTAGTSTLTFTVANPSGNPGALSGVSFSAAIPANLSLSGAATTCAGGTVSIAGGAISLGNAGIAAGASCTVTATALSTTAGSYAIVADGPNSTSPATTGVDGNTATLQVQSPAPTVSSIAPTGGSTGGGTPVTITGTNFFSANTYTATFGATAVAATYASATTLTATAPAGGAGPVQVTVTNSTTSQAGAGSASYTYAAPTVTGLSANAGPANTTRSVTVTGTNFTPSATVTIGGSAATGVTYAGATTLIVTLPPKAAGTYDVLVTTGSVTSAANPPTSSYTYVPAPTVTSVTPSSGSTTGGIGVTVSGSNLTGASSVTFGGAAASNVVVAADGQSLTATTPAGSAGTTTVAVTTPGGTGQLAGGYTYFTLAPPAVTTQPQSQTVAAGQATTFSAQASGTPSPTVRWQVSSDGGATFANINGATTTSYTTPATVAADNGKLFRAVFTNSQGTATSAAATLTVTAPPAVTTNPANQTVNAGATASFTAASSGSPAPTVQWQVSTNGGANFSNIAGATGPTYSFTAAAANNGYQYRAVFTNATGTATSTAATLTVIGTPTANNQSASTGFNTATAITLTGSDPNTPPRALTYTVTTPPAHGTVGGTAPNLTYTPNANYIGQDSFTFTVSNGTSTSSPATVSITVGAPLPPAAPVVTAPANGAATSDITPTVAGTTVAGTTVAIYFDAALSGAATVTGTSFSYTPATALGQGSHSVYAVAANAGGPSPTSAANGFIVDSVAPAAPTIAAPANGATVSVRRPMVTGNAESGSTVSVTINGTLAGTAAATSGSYTYTPTADLAVGPNTVSVFATDAAGNQSATSSSTFTVVAQPAVTGVSPAEGPIAGGTTITVTGTNLTGVTSVSVGGNPATAVQVTSNTSLNAVTPAKSAAGPVQVSVANQAGTSSTNGSFTYIAPPVADDQTVAAAYNTGNSLNRTSVVLSASNNPTAYALVTGPQHGSLTGTAPNLTYISNGGYNGPDSFTFRASNAAGSSNVATITLNVVAPTIMVTGTTPSGTRGAAYSATLTSSGGTAPYLVRLSAGALPGGLTLSTSGATTTRISGIPTASGTFTGTITATDSSQPGASGAYAFSITIAGPTPTISPAGAALPGGTVGVAYGQSFSTSGATAPYDYTISAGTLPAGLALSSGGMLSGTPSMAGSYSFTVTSTDSSAAASGGPYNASRSYTLGIGAPTVVVAPAGGFAPATVGAPYSQQAGASGGTGPYTYAITAGALPAGLSLASDGTISGTATAGGSFNFTLTATDSSTGTGAPFSGSRAYTLTANPAAIAVSPGSLPNGTTGIAYSQQVSASGGTAPYTFSATGTVPTGLSLSSSGLLSGTPRQSGSFTFTIQATDSSTGAGARFSGSRTYTVVVTAPTITIAPATLPNPRVGAAYSQTLTATGTVDGYAFAVTGGALPAGLALDVTGKLAGTPTAGGSYTFTVTVVDASGNTGAKTYSFTVDAAVVMVAPATLPDATTRVDYTQTLTASGGTAPYTYAVTAGALPNGLTLASTGTLSGAATTGGSYTFTITATDSSTGSSRSTGQRSYTLAVNAPAITVAPDALPAATTRVAYSQTLTAAGGAGPYAFAVTAGALPSGLTLSAAGQLSGSATAGGSYTFTVTATDADSNTGARSYTLGVTSPAIAVSPDVLPAATARVAYSQTLTASGGTAPYGFAVTAGALPTGITLASGGTLSGTTSAAGNYSFTVTATDGNGNAGARGYALTVAAPALTIAPPSLPNAQVGQAYGQTLTASGGAAPYRFAVTAGALPAGVSLSTAGILSGTPTAGGASGVTITATDANGSAVARSYTFTIDAAQVAVAPASLPAGQVRASYSQSLTASGGTAPYSYVVSAGALPGGLTLAADGTLSGTPAQSGSFAFTVTAKDSSTGSGPYSASRSYTLAIGAPALALAPDTLPDTVRGAAYGQALTATGGTAPYTYAATGTLPPGLTLSAGGVLSGRATAAGSYGFTVTATDATNPGNGGPYTASRSYTVAVSAPTITLAPTMLPAGTTRVAYSQALSASGGLAPYGYAVTAGALPQGLTLATGGTLSGTPTAAGSFGFTVTASDANGNGGGQAYTLTIAAPAVALAPATLPGGTYNTSYAQTLTATGGTAPYAYAVTAGALPGGVTLASGGALAGTPGAAGSYGFTVTATDADGNAGTQTYTVAIGQQAQVITFADPGARSLSDSPVTLAATASSGLAVGFASTTTNVCTVQGDVLTLVATGTCSIEVSQAGSGDVAAATPVARSFAVTAARLVATQAQATVTGQVGVALAPVVPVTVAGGTAPYAYALSGGTLPAGLGFSTATGTLSGTPTGGQEATGYTVTLRDGSGQSASGAFTLAVAAPALAIAPTALPQGAYQVAYSQQLSAAGGTQPYRFAVTAGALPAGVTLTAEGLVSGTPIAFGRFEVTITATDSSTGGGPYSVAQVYTLTVQPPTAPTAGDVSATVAYGTADAAITPVLGGEVTTLAIATAPTHGTARVDARTLVYKPTPGYSGPDSFTYTASNVGGASTPGTVSVTVSAATVAITPTTLPGAQQDVAYSQQLTAAGGAAPYVFALASGTLPPGLTLTPAGVLAGTPTASWSSTFAVRATDSSTGSGPATATQSYTLAVALPAAPTVRAVPTVNAPGSSAVASTPTRIVLSDYVAGNYTAIRIAAPPQNGTVTLTAAGAQTIATYVPRANFAGTDSFSFVAVGPGGQSPVQPVALAVAGAAPVAVPLTAATIQGVPATVDLTAAATGGPFTAATVTAVSPAGSVTTALVEGGTAAARTYHLTLTPSLDYSGTATITYTLSNQYGASAPVAVTLTVSARPDPTADPAVNAISASQAESTRRFARAQIDNFTRRNEQLHHGGAGTGGRDMGVRMALGLGGLLNSATALPAPDETDMAMLKSDHARGVLGAELASGAIAMRDTADGGGMGGVAGLRGRQAIVAGSAADARTRRNVGHATGTGADGDAPDGGSTERRTGSVGLWSGGAVTVGAWDQEANRAKLTLTSGGLSAGADVKLGETLIVGLGGGYGADTTRIGGGQASIRGDSWSIAGYGSWSPVDGLFVDGVFGGGALSFDTRRQIVQTGATAMGHRDGRMIFGSLAAGLDRRGDAMDLSVYGRADYLAAHLDRFSEIDGNIYGLTYARRSLDSLAGVLGGRVAFPLAGWTPRFRGEWRHEFADIDAQVIDYADVANLRYTTRGDTWMRDAFTLDIGSDFDLGSGWTLTTEIGASAGSGATAGTGRAGVRKQF